MEVTRPVVITKGGYRGRMATILDDHVTDLFFIQIKNHRPHYINRNKVIHVDSCSDDEIRIIQENARNGKYDKK